MATIVTRSDEDGQVTGYQARIRRKGYPPQSRTFERKSDARMWARHVENEMDRGVFVSRAEAETTTLFDALERYMREVTPKKRGADTEQYRIKALQSEDIARKTLASIKGADVAKYRDAELKRGLAPSTITKALALLSHLYSTAQREWSIEVDNPVRKVSKPRVNNARDRRLTDAEWRYLLAACDEPGDAVKIKDRDRRNTQTPRIVRFAVETAMRRGEILALDWQHVDLERRVAHLCMTKNGTSRDVPLSPAAITILRPPGTVQQLRWGPVFPTSASALEQSYMRAVRRGRRMYIEDCKKSGAEPEPGFLENLTFHDLRHEATSRLAERLQMHELMRVTGHRDPRMLARYYHPRAEDLARKLA